MYHGEGDAGVDFVLSLNMVRRHLTHNDKVVAANKALPYYTSEARQRQGTRTDLTPDISANMRESGKATEHVAQQFGISARSVEQGQVVYRDGAPELVEAFENNHVSVSAAAEVATLPEEEQREKYLTTVSHL